MNRTHTNGELRLSDVGKKVSLIGWVAKRRNFGALVFIDLRDREGITQLVFDESIASEIKNVRNEYILEVSGEVLERKDVLYEFTSEPSKGKKSVVVLKKPKTLSSIRKVWLPKTLAYILREWKKEQDEYKKFFGPEYKPYDLVVCFEDSKD